VLSGQVAEEKRLRLSAERRVARLADSLRAERVVEAPAGGPGTATNGGARSLLQAWEAQELQRKGLEDPATELLADLAKRPELLPYRGSLGGTMRIWPGQSTVLSREWVYAYFEDGHRAGHALFAYTVDDSGGIRWQRLAAHIDD
jgi:hypothetical protein